MNSPSSRLPRFPEFQRGALEPGSINGPEITLPDGTSGILTGSTPDLLQPLPPISAPEGTSAFIEEALGFWLGYTHEFSIQPPEDSVSYSLDQLAVRLRAWGLETKVETAQSIEDLAWCLEEEDHVIIAVNAGLWQQDADLFHFGEWNRLEVVIGLVRDSGEGLIQGVYCAQARPGEKEDLKDTETLQVGWLQTGGVMLRITLPEKL